MLDSLTKFFNALHTKPLHLSMGILKHCCRKGRYKTCQGNMLAGCPNGTLRTSACKMGTTCNIHCKHSAAYFQYTAVYSQVYGRVLGGIRLYTCSIRCSLVAPRMKAIGHELFKRCI